MTFSIIQRATDLLHYMPIIVRADGIPPADRKFCASMIARGRRDPVSLSIKQDYVVNRIVDDFRNRTMRGGNHD